MSNEKEPVVPTPDWYRRVVQHENFRRFVQFGIVDQSLLLVSLLAGFSLDGVIARRIGAKGWGAIVGAGVGNVAADTIAGLPEGLPAALGVATGGVIPLVPIFTAMALRRELKGTTSYVVGGSSVLLFIGTFIHSYSYNSQHPSSPH